MTRPAHRSRRLLPSSLRVRVAGVLLVVGLLGAGVSAWHGQTLVGGEVARREQQALVREATRLQGTVEYLLRERAVDRLRDEIASLGSDPELEVAHVIDPSGRIVASIRQSEVGREQAAVVESMDDEGDAEALTRPVSRYEGARVERSGDDAVVTAPITFFTNGGVPSQTGRLVIARDLDRASAASAAGLREQTLAISVVLVMLALAAWAILHLTVTRRLQRVVAVARRLAEGDRSARVRLRGRDEVAQVSRALDVLADEVEAAHAQLMHDALHDPLTDLPNRALFEDRLVVALERRRSEGQAVAVMFVDLDRFKVVNDSLGHHVGDDLLRIVASRFQDALWAEDTVARLGGDEFAVLCEPVASAAEAVAIAERLHRAISGPATIAGREIVVAASVGVALGRPGDAPAMVLRDADAAMYRAKALGKGQVALFGDELRASAVSRLDTEVALRRAIARGEVVVEYQPIVALSDGRPAAAEALVRWLHPERGLLPPSEFLAIARETGLILALGRIVLRSALHQAAHWRGLDGAPQSVWINLSAVELADPTLVADIATALDEAGLPGDVLCVEITEDALVDVEAPASNLRGLAELGVRLALDDFGTGYSSLERLQRFSVDVLKIDRRFTQRLGRHRGDEQIVEAVVKLAHTLGMVVVGEGVEHKAQAAFLRRVGCDLGQGFHFAGPGPASMLTPEGGNGVLVGSGSPGLRVHGSDDPDRYTADARSTELARRLDRRSP